MACALMFGVGVVNAGPILQIDWFSIDGGGGNSAGGNFAVTGVIGQPDAGSMAGGNFAIEGGFLAVGGTIATPTPTPTITPTPTPTPAPECVIFTVTLNGAQEVPPNASSATGFAVVTVDTVNNMLMYDITFSGLGSMQTDAHIHGFAPPGMEAAPVHSIALGSPVMGTWNYDEADEPNILAGLTYINIHTQVFAGGEIRGQIANGVECDRTIDFTGGGAGNAQGWIGGAVPGFGGATSIGGFGLCMTVPGPGDNFVLWLSPERYVDLVSSIIYRMRVTLVTDQSDVDAIPLFFLVHDNFNTGGTGNNYGGFSWLLDVDGGAQGIQRPQGRTMFDFFVAPNPINTPQWQAGAFTPMADLENDMRLQIRIIDANSTLLTDADSGTICMPGMQITAVPRVQLAVDSVVFNAPISSATHFAQAFDEMGSGGTATIDDPTNTANYQLPVTGTTRKTLGYFDGTQLNLNTQLFPAVWEGDTLYRSRARIRASASESDPVDAVLLAFDTTNVELGTTQFSTRGAPGGVMDLVASPKLTAAEYETYFYGQNATASMIPDANRLRPLTFFFNAPELASDGTGGDAFVVEAVEVDKLIVP